MNQTIYDGKRNGLYRSRVEDFLIDRGVRNMSMTDAHYHPYYEFFYVTRGNCRMFVEHSLFSVSSGELVILPPSTLHRTQYDTDSPVERITLNFTPDYALDLEMFLGKGFLENQLKVGKMRFIGKSSDEFFSLLEKFLEENSRSDSFSTGMRKGLLAEILVLIARNTEQMQDKEFLIDEAEANIQDAAKYIFEHYAEDITLEDASSVAKMRDTYFSKKFRDVTGFGFKEYLTNIRIQHSAEMLTSGNLTVTQVALSCGFSDANYFGDIFKKKTGFSPRDFRRMKQN